MKFFIVNPFGGHDFNSVLIVWLFIFGFERLKAIPDTYSNLEYANTLFFVIWMVQLLLKNIHNGFNIIKFVLVVVENIVTVEDWLTTKLTKKWYLIKVYSERLVNVIYRHTIYRSYNLNIMPCMFNFIGRYITIVEIYRTYFLLMKHHNFDVWSDENSN